MSRALLLTIRFHDGRYHGVPDWPPSPARLFQALVAAAARGDELSAGDKAALQWLEALEPPVFGAPPARKGNAIRNYVPNNDLDAVGRDPARIGEIRSAKLVRPQIFDAAIPLLYVWSFEPSLEADASAAQICIIAERLIQLGRGVDMAWANGEVLNSDEAEARLSAHRGPVHRPSYAFGGSALPCPAPGSLASLITRHLASGKRFAEIREDRQPSKANPATYKVLGTTFTQPPKPRFRQVAYSCPPALLLFDLSGEEAPWMQTRIVQLVMAVRDAASAKLQGAYNNENRADDAATVEPVFIGRNAANGDKSVRIRIMALPSIGSPHVTRAIRRVLVEVPPNCPIPQEDILWTFSGLSSEIADAETGEITDLWRLTQASDHKMLSNYGVEPARNARVWRSVTPVALTNARRRRIDPTRVRAEVKGGHERLAEEDSARAAVSDALRHAGVTASAVQINVQREPFAGREARAEAFAAESRFAKETLWHVEIKFESPPRAPLLIGDGRYLGLGLLRPVESRAGVLAFRITAGLQQETDPTAITRALRRAVMARAQDALGEKKPLPMFFSGHGDNGAAARKGNHQHLAFAFDRSLQRLLVFSPANLEHRKATKEEQKHWQMLQVAVSGLTELRAGKAGLLELIPAEVEEDDRWVRPSLVWQSATPYRVNRHARAGSSMEAIAVDLRASLLALKLPMPEIQITPQAGAPYLEGLVTLTFPVAVSGPLLLGKTRHFGGGAFVAT